MIKKYKKRILVLTILLGVVLLIAGTTYAIFKASASQTTQNDITTLNCFEVEYSDVTDAIALTNDFPISDAEGLERTPYTFKIKNKCTQLLNVQIGVETLSTSQIEPNLIKGIITNKGETPTSAKLLSNGILGTPVNGGTNYILLESSLAAFETKEFDLRLWFTESMTKEQGSGKTYQGKVTVISSPKTDKTVYGKLLADYFNNNGVKKTTDENGKEIYYYTGNITNNNLVLNNYCWKMVRTTETDGVKLIYNGKYDVKELYEKIAKDTYSVTTNTPTETPFTFDETTKKWTSGIAGVKNGENTIEFTVTEAGNYFLNYEVSSETNYDKGSFYKNGTELKAEVSGVDSGTIELNELSTSDVIKVVYKKDGSGDKNDDVVRFSIGKPTGSFTTNCNNTGTNVYIDSKDTTFNTGIFSPAYVGYMYGTVYESAWKRATDLGTYYYGSDVTWNGTTYTLNDAESGAIADMYSKLSTKHYTCFSTSTSCSTVYYIYEMDGTNWSDYAYYMTLTNGKKIEAALDEMLNYNTTNSNIKTVIDSWYSTNMTNVTEYLENAIYCNNRYITNLSASGWNPSGGSLTTYLQFNDYINYRLTCQDKEDQFTLKVDKGGTLGYGNNALDYSVGLLTSKEVSLAFGGANTNYLNNGDKYWLLSPLHFADGHANVRYVRDGDLSASTVTGTSWVRPAVSLKQNILITGGTGEIEDPYTVALPD